MPYSSGKKEFSGSDARFIDDFREGKTDIEAVLNIPGAHLPDQFHIAPPRYIRVALAAIGEPPTQDLKIGLDELVARYSGRSSRDELCKTIDKLQAIIQKQNEEIEKLRSGKNEF